MTMLEKDLEKKLVDGIKARGGLCLKWVSPGSRGVPDRILLLPGGRIAFAEMKRPKGARVDPLQKYWKRILTGLGFRVFTIFTEEELHSVLFALDWEVTP